MFYWLYAFQVAKDYFLLSFSWFITFIEIKGIIKKGKSYAQRVVFISGGAMQADGSEHLSTMILTWFFQ